MLFLHYLWNIIYHAALILKKDQTGLSRNLLLVTYLKLQFKYLIFTLIFKYKLTSESIFGFKINVLDYWAFLGMFEEIFIQKQYYFDSRNRRPLIVDCGSNIGLSVVFFKILYPEAKIIAFEPDTITYRAFRKNILTNQLADVKLYNYALWTSSGKANFYYSRDHPGMPKMSLIKRRLPKSSRKVDTVLLSNYINGPVDFLKIDIEGAEDKVIEELASNDKLRQVKEMVTELHHHVDPNSDHLSKTLEILEDHKFGYQVRTNLISPFKKRTYQDILIYAYRR